MSYLLGFLFVSLTCIGTALCLLAAVGILRLPDVYTRMQAASKASTLGAACILVATALYSDHIDVAIRALLIVFFLFMTTPVAAHMIGRVAYLTGVPLAKGTDLDELAGRYDERTHELAGSAEQGDDPPTPADES